MSLGSQKDAAGAIILQQLWYISVYLDYRGQCLEKAETDRMLSSRLSLLESSYSQTRSGFDKQADDTNRKYYKKFFILLANLIHLCLEGPLTSSVYSV